MDSLSVPILITGATRLLPGQSRRDEGPIFVQDGVIRELPEPLPADLISVDGRGLVLAPALLDLHVHLREPGMEEAETIATGTRAAAAGGFGAVVAMPNTQPPVDSVERLQWLMQRAAETAVIRVYPCACLTRERAGREAVEVEALAEAGAAAFSDDGSTVQDDSLMEALMDRIKRTGRPILDHAEKVSGDRDGVLHEGSVSTRLGLPGIPAEAEIEMIQRRIELCRKTGCRVHIQHVSTGEGARLISSAQAEGLPVTAEVTPHHLALSEEDVVVPDPNFKMNPPLRSKADREQLRQAVVSGAISCLATDHAPHTPEAKQCGFRDAPFGVVGLETAIGVTFTELVAGGLMEESEWLARWVSGPRQVLGLPQPHLQAGEPADLVLLDLDSEWTVRCRDFLSRGRNTPFEGRRVIGRACLTIAGGRISWVSERLKAEQRIRYYGSSRGISGYK